ncbi:MAG: hypothetical protein QXR45_12125 [Candidatus Bathyarchaeia archaeon]
MNSLVSKGYIPIIKPREDYKLRNVGEGIFKDRLKIRRKESTNARIMFRFIVYCLKILVM